MSGHVLKVVPIQGYGGIGFGVCALPQIFSAPIAETMRRMRTRFQGARMVRTISITVPSLVGDWRSD